jgi:hypothetical protein
MHPTFLWQRGGGPEGEVAEEGTFAAGDEADAAFFVLKAFVTGFEDVVVDAGEPAVAADFDGDAVPGLGIELDADFLEFFAARFFGDAAHLLNPNGGGGDHDAALMQVGAVRVAADEADLRRWSELEFAGEHEVAEVGDDLADGFMAIGSLFAGAFLNGVGRAVHEFPLADAAAPAVGARLALFADGRWLIELVGADESAWLAEFCRGRGGGISEGGRGEGEGEKTQGEVK